MIEKHDNTEGYCRKLGHFLSFNYCRTVNNNLPCSKVLDCWFQHFPIQQFIKDNYSEKEHSIIFEPPEPKLQSLSEILQNAQQRLGKDDIK